MQTQTPPSPHKPPVILQVLPSLRSGGVERGTIDIARAIVQAGGKSLVASAGGPMATQLNNFGAKHITLPLDKKSPLAIWRNARRLTKVIREHKVDIVHARSRAPAWSALIATRRTGAHFITTFHGVYGTQNFLKRLYNSVMTRGERVIAISNFIASHIQKNYVMDPERMRVIHRGVDMKLFTPSGHSARRMIELTKEWRLPDDLPLILFPGRITRWKGQDVFLQALAKLPHRNFFAVILGDDKGHETFRRDLEKLISKSGLEGHVRISRHTHYIGEAYMLARIVVSTSIDPEAFGRVVLEAQAMGKPVIATNHGGPQETVVPDVTGWLVAPRNVKDLSALIGHALMLDDVTLHEMGDRARENAHNFTLEKMCAQTLMVYGEVLGIAPHVPEELPQAEMLSA